ncbi:hypothetical protein DSUL_50304 [Desulfovibrionales bacterium]
MAVNWDELIMVGIGQGKNVHNFIPVFIFFLKSGLILFFLNLCYYGRRLD